MESVKKTNTITKKILNLIQVQERKREEEEDKIALSKAIKQFSEELVVIPKK